MAKVTLASGSEFDAGPDVPLLEAGEREGVRLAYSCRTGRCSTCKAQVASGSTTVLHEETGLEPGEAEAGWILTCVRAAETDVVLAQDNEVPFDLPRPSTQPLRLTTLERVSEDVLVVTFRLPPSARWTYHAGQHVEIIGTGGVRRAYSLASAPGSGLELHVKRLPGGVLSDYWFDAAAPDDLLRLYGPLGTFVLRGTDRPLVFLATGTGVAPVKALLEQLRGLERPPSVRVYVGARTVEDLYWTLQDLPPGTWPAEWAFVPVLSRPGPDWQGRTGYVQHALLADVPSLGDTDVYACGSEAMIHDARRLLIDAGLDPRRFFSDAFVDSSPAEDDA